MLKKILDALFGKRHNVQTVTTSAGGQKMSIYTPEMEAELKVLGSKGPITFATAEAWAAERGLKVRSVVAKIRSMKLAYEPKPTKVTKTGEPVVLKETIVKSIEAAIGVSLPSLVKMGKADLETLAKAIVTE